MKQNEIKFGTELIAKFLNYKKIEGHGKFGKDIYKLESNGLACNVDDFKVHNSIGALIDIIKKFDEPEFAVWKRKSDQCWVFNLTKYGVMEVSETIEKAAFRAIVRAIAGGCVK